MSLLNSPLNSSSELQLLLMCPPRPEPNCKLEVGLALELEPEPEPWLELEPEPEPWLELELDLGLDLALDFKLEIESAMHAHSLASRWSTQACSSEVRARMPLAKLLCKTMLFLLTPNGWNQKPKLVTRFLLVCIRM
jgi:hypothetical protein